MLKILTVVGARPQFIKAAMINKRLLAAGINEIIVHTGQHYDDNMSDIFFRELGIDKPKYFLGVNGGSHGQMTGRMMERLEEIMQQEQPQMLLVYGDTNSTLAAALTAKKLGIKICHVEAGLRSHDTSIPEEVNRVLTDRVSDIVICPTQLAIDNLKKEGFESFPIKIFLTGDLMADAFFESSASEKQFELPYKRDTFAYCTIHRASNTKPEVLKRIIEGLNKISEETPIYFPIHPRTQMIIESEKISLSPKIRISKPIGYYESIAFLKASKFVITDSGGVQREAYLAKKQALLIMSYTPWQELVDGGYSVLSMADKDDMVEGVKKMNNLVPDWSTNFYGTGTGAAEIVKILVQEIGK